MSHLSGRLISQCNVIGGRQCLTRSVDQGCLTLENLRLQRGRKATVGLTQVTVKKLFYGCGKCHFVVRVEHVFAAQTTGDHEDRQVADHLRARRHLDDVTKHLIDFRVGVRHFRPPRVIDAESTRLLAQVGVLTARHAVHIDIGGAGANITFKGSVKPAYLFPVVGDQSQIGRIELRIAFGVAQCCSDRPQVRL